jgi:hypothetical protein
MSRVAAPPTWDTDTAPTLLVPLAALTPAAWNPRLITTARFQQLCDSLQVDPDFLWERPVLANAAGIIYGGNHRYRAAEHLGWEAIPARRREIPDRLARERALRDNNQWADWVEQDLAELLVGLQVEGSDLPSLGFPDHELARLLDSVGALGDTAVPEAQIDRAAELQVQWGTALGQLWEIPSATGPGRAHRLLCGDSTDAATVARLMGGEQAALTLTDPPYNVGVDYGAAVDDARADYAEFCRAWLRLCPAAVIVLTPGIVNLALWYTQVRVPTWVCAWRKVNQCSHSGLGGFNTWEPLLVYGRPAAPVGHDSWEIPVAQVDIAHPVPKTVEAWCQFVTAFSAAGALVHDAFVGSGTTVVVAEQSGRVCYGLELEPKYVAVALQRLADLGLTPRRVEG